MKRLAAFVAAGAIALAFASPAAGMERGPFNAAVIEGLNAKVTIHGRRAFAAEGQAEGGGAKNNPFNTTAAAPGATCYNVFPCVKNYPTSQVGIEATIRTLKEPGHGYWRILQPLRANAPARKIVRGFGTSQWGTNLPLVLAVLDDIIHGRTPNTLGQLEATPIAN